MGKEKLRTILMDMTMEELNALELEVCAIISRREQKTNEPQVIPVGESA